MRAKALTIVVPVYRADFLQETLSAIEAQTDRHFALILSLDGPVDGVAPALDIARSKLGATIHAFPNNIGSYDPTQHWERSINLVETEWVWLLGDDDLPGPKCVELFHRYIPEPQQALSLTRFASRPLSSKKVSRRFAKAGETALSVDKLLKQRLKGRDFSFASEYIFRVEAIRQTGGFVSFPHAWCSDDATWTRLAAIGGCLEIIDSSAEVVWRDNSGNTSSRTIELKDEFQEAELQFAEWLTDDSPVKDNFLKLTWQISLINWLLRQMRQKSLTASEERKSLRRLSKSLTVFAKMFIIPLWATSQGIKIVKSLSGAVR